MPAKLAISQIFIPNHQLAANFVSAYQETVRTDTPASLFLIVEIRGDKKPKSAKRQAEYEKVAQAMARVLKSSYLSERVVIESTFEKALTAINNELQSLGRRGVVGWYKNLNALVAVCAQDVMYLSATGQMSGLLLRKREFSSISESLAGNHAPHPIKTFLNFASGALVPGDCVLLTTTGLYNYLSLEKLRGTLSREELNEASRQLVETLKTDMGAQDAFAAFVCAYHSRPRLSDTELQPLISPAAHTIIEDRESFSSPAQKNWRLAKRVVQKILGALVAFAQMAGAGALWMWRQAFSRSKKSPAAGGRETPQPRQIPPNAKRRTYLIAFLLAAILLVINLIFFNFRNARMKVDVELSQKLETATEALTQAEAAMIYDDENRARAEVDAAQSALTDVKKSSKFAVRAKTLQDKIDALARQLNKIAEISAIETLGHFTHTPDVLIKLPDGFLGFNTYTDAFGKLQLPAGATQTFPLTQPVPENLIDGVYLPALSAPVFLSVEGHAFKLNFETGELASLSATSTAQVSAGEIKGLAIYENRLYSVDRQNSQILRYTQSGQFIDSPASWLKQAVDLTNARALAVDGSIFVLAGDGVAKFTLGKPQTFSAPKLADGIQDATRIHTEKSQNYIYLVDPKHSRILVLTKTGGLFRQLVSEKFSELKDIWVDEGNKTIYALLGNEVGRFEY